MPTRPARMNRVPYIIFLSIVVLPVASTLLPASEKTELIRLQTPALLSFAELVELGTVDEVSPALKAKLDRLLTTPFISNEAHYQGIRPLRTVHPQLGSFLRACFWNIERGLNLDQIKAIFAGPQAFAEEIDTEQLKPESEDYRQTLEQAAILRESNLLILNEVDLGLKRTDYRDVTRELAGTLGMNYAFGVEFMEVDPLMLGLETFEGAAEEDKAEMQREIKVDESRYRGIHGTAILSRYPIRKATLKPFSYQGHDWYFDEKKGVARLEGGKRALGEKVFLEKVLREIRRGGRMMLTAELEVPELAEGTVTVVATHLEARCKPQGRLNQMHELLLEVKERRHPVIIGGDMNTTGTDNTPTTIGREVKKRLGSGQFWATRGVKYATGVGLFMDVMVGSFGFVRSHSDPTVRNVFLVAPNPEARMFDLLEKMRFADGNSIDFRGDPHRTSNQRSGTLANSNQRNRKGFAVTFSTTRTPARTGQFKLDWFFVKSFSQSPRDTKASYRFAPHFARTLRALNYSVPDRISDHYPITVDLPFAEPKIWRK